MLAPCAMPLGPFRHILAALVPGIWKTAPKRRCALNLSRTDKMRIGLANIARHSIFREGLRYQQYQQYQQDISTILNVRAKNDPLTQTVRAVEKDEKLKKFFTELIEGIYVQRGNSFDTTLKARYEQVITKNWFYSGQWLDTEFDTGHSMPKLAKILGTFRNEREQDGTLNVAFSIARCTVVLGLVPREFDMSKSTKSGQYLLKDQPIGGVFPILEQAASYAKANCPMKNGRSYLPVVFLFYDKVEDMRSWYANPKGLILRASQHSSPGDLGLVWSIDNVAAKEREAH